MAPVGADQSDRHDGHTGGPVLGLLVHAAPPDVDRLSGTRLRDVFGERLHGEEFSTRELSPCWHGELRAPLTGGIDVSPIIPASGFNEARGKVNRIASPWVR